MTDGAFSPEGETLTVLVTGVSRYLGANLAARLAGASPRWPCHRCRRRRTQQGGVAFPRRPGRGARRRYARTRRSGRGHRRRSGRPHGCAVQPRWGRTAGDEGIQHHRHDAAARREPGRTPVAQAGGAVVHRRLRRLVPGSGRVHRVDPADAVATRWLRQGRHRDRGLRARLQPSPAGRAHHGSAPGAVCRSGRATPRSLATSPCQWCRRCWAAIHGCSSSMWRTPSKCSPDQWWKIIRVRTTWPDRACSSSPRPSAGPGGSRCLWSSRACRRWPHSCGHRVWADFNLDQLDLFVHGRVVDTSRLVAEFGFEPRSTEEAFDALIRGRGLHRPGSFAALRPDAVSAVEAAILDGIRAIRAATTGRATQEPAHD